MKILGHDYLIRFADGIELEITGPRIANQKLTPGHARSIAIDYLENIGCIPAAIVSTERLSPDKARHAQRLAEVTYTVPLGTKTARHLRVVKAQTGLRTIEAGSVLPASAESAASSCVEGRASSD